MRAGTALRAGRNGDHTVSAIPGGIDIALLRRNRLLSLLEPAEMDEVLRFARIRKVQPEERIFAKGDPGDCMYAILKGRVSVETESEDAKVMLLNLLDAGDVFGEIAMLDGGERTASVTAIQTGELLRIDRRDFLPFLERHPSLSIRLMVVLCARLRWTSGIIEDTVFLDVPRRLAKRILFLMRTYGRPSAEGTRITEFISQEDLAHMLGVSREIVNKTLRSFQKSDAVTYSNGYIIVRNEEFLEKISD